MVPQQMKLISLLVPDTSTLQDAYFQTIRQNTSMSTSCQIHNNVQYLKCCELVTCPEIQYHTITVTNDNHISYTSATNPQKCHKEKLTNHICNTDNLFWSLSQPQK